VACKVEAGPSGIMHCSICGRNSFQLARCELVPCEPFSMGRRTNRRTDQSGAEHSGSSAVRWTCSSTAQVSGWINVVTCTRERSSIMHQISLCYPLSTPYCKEHPRARIAWLCTASMYKHQPRTHCGGHLRTQSTINGLAYEAPEHQSPAAGLHQ
jgi:hypothetical protein